jgi:glycosyltransferase involved in cell wall biosynthesis
MPLKIFILSDAPQPSGFGRISGEIAKRLALQGHAVFVGSILYDGAMPNDLARYVYHIAPLAGRDIWTYTTNLINMNQPDVVICCQDFPYAHTLYRACRIDWSRHALVVITPIDGTPIAKDWLELVDDVDGTLVISRFGVEAMRQAGKMVDLCHPAIDPLVFHPAPPEEKTELRARAGIAPDAFVMGMFAMNQGRKNIPATIRAFDEFAKDKTHARLLLDMDKQGSWDIHALARDMGADVSKIILREDMQKKGLLSLRDRYCLLDVHSVISRREGFGLPLLESQACGVVAMALDWCSGTEICGQGKGVLIPCDGQGTYGGWGNALDKEPDMPAFVAALQDLYDHPEKRAYIAANGLAWARAQTWDNAALAVTETIDKAVRRHKESYKNYVASVSHNTNLQPTPLPVEVLALAQRDDATQRDGDNLSRRLLNGIQPNGAHQNGAHDPQSNEQGLRSDLQRGGASGDGRLSPILEFRHVGKNGELGEPVTRTVQ